LNIELIKRWRKCKEKRAELEKERAELWTQMENLEAMIVEEMGGSGIQEMTVEGRSYFVTPDSLYVTKANEDVTPEQIIAALDACDLGSLAERGFNWQTLRSTVREFHDEGKVPDELLAVLKVTTGPKLGDRAK
jgi:hypothetical protein